VGGVGGVDGGVVDGGAMGRAETTEPRAGVSMQVLEGTCSSDSVAQEDRRAH